MTEQYILGEMLDILIEKNTGLNVEITQGVGGEHLISSQLWRMENLTFIQSIQVPAGIWYLRK